MFLTFGKRTEHMHKQSQLMLTFDLTQMDRDHHVFVSRGNIDDIC